MLPIKGSIRKKMREENIRKKCSALVLGISSLVFYIFFAVYDGVVICADSPSYINMDMSREPLYPIFLALLRHLFGTQNDFYLHVVVLIQSILAAFAAYTLVNFLQKEFALKNWVSIMLLAIPIGTSLLCRFAAKRSSMYSNSILTEGLAISLFLVFMRYLLEYCYTYSRKRLINATICTWILFSIRKQMVLSLLLLILVIIYCALKKRKIIYGIATCIICMVCVLGGNYALDAGYNYATRGVWTTHSSDNRFLSTVIFYVAEREDAILIPDENTREVFLEIYDICDKNGYLIHNAEEGWYNRVTHFGNCYDCIQIDTLWPMLELYVRENYSGSDAYLAKMVDQYNENIILALLPKLWPRLGKIFADNYLSGLITTVARRTPVLIKYSIGIWTLYLVLLVLHVREYGVDKIAILGIGTLLSILLNVSIVSAVIFCQTRYTIYNMPLFYISLYLLVVERITNLMKINLMVTH